MEPDGSLPHSQVPATCPYPEPARSSPYPPHPTSRRSILILSFHIIAICMYILLLYIHVYVYISLCSLFTIVTVKPKSLAPARLLPSFWPRSNLGGGSPFCVTVQRSPHFGARPGLFQLRRCEERVAVAYPGILFGRRGVQQIQLRTEKTGIWGR